MSNPFDEPPTADSRYLALSNARGQYSLWPAWIDLPKGWTVAHPADTRQTCLDHIEAVWTDLRPPGAEHSVAAR